MSNRVARVTVATVCALAAFSLMGAARLSPRSAGVSTVSKVSTPETHQPPALAQAPQPVTVELTAEATDGDDAELLYNAPAEQAAGFVPAFKPAPRVIRMEVTAYCACKKCCGPKAIGLTASGKRVSHNGGRFVAADRKFRFGTKLQIPGYANGQVVPVLDRGGAIKGNKLDVFFPTHKEALKWGRQKLYVTVIE